jgi:hypothetical protein
LCFQPHPEPTAQPSNTIQHKHKRCTPFFLVFFFQRHDTPRRSAADVAHYLSKHRRRCRGQGLANDDKGSNVCRQDSDALSKRKGARERRSILSRRWTDEETEAETEENKAETARGADDTGAPPAHFTSARGRHTHVVRQSQSRIHCCVKSSYGSHGYPVLRKYGNCPRPQTVAATIFRHHL